MFKYLSDAVESDMEAVAIQQDSENSMIRYIIWAITSIGLYWYCSRNWTGFIEIADSER